MDALRRLLQRPTLPGLLVVLAAVLIFANSLPAEFVLDDYPAVVTNRGAQWPPDWSGIWLKNYWGSPDNYKSLTIYRPLATLTFAITDGLGGGGCPACHRWVNIGLHALSSLLVLLLAWHLCAAVVPPQRKPGTARALAATAAGLLFALHPVHTEAVVGVVSRAELLAALFVLLGTLMLLRLRVGRAPLLAIVYALALLSKENGATLWAVAMGYHLAAYAAERFGRGTRLDRRELWLHAVFAAVLLFYMALRSQAVEGLLAGDLSPSDNPIAEAGLLARIASPFMVLYQYVALLVAPATLTIDYSLNHVPPVLSVADLRFWAGLALFAGSLAALWAAVRRRFAVAFVLLGFYATYVVVSNTLFLSTIIMAERLIYLPSAFFVLLLVLGCLPVVLRLDARGRGVVTALLVAVLALFGVRTVERNADWLTPMSLYRSAVATAPQSAKSRHLLANALLARGQALDALAHYEVASAIDPDNFVLRTNTARTLARLGRYEDALPHLEAALTRHPGYRPAFALVCAIYERTGRPPAAGRYCFPENEAPKGPPGQ